MMADDGFSVAVGKSEKTVLKSWRSERREDFLARSRNSWRTVGELSNQCSSAITREMSGFYEFVIVIAYEL